MDSVIAEEIITKAVAVDRLCGNVVFCFMMPDGRYVESAPMPLEYWANRQSGPLPEGLLWLEWV